MQVNTRGNSCEIAAFLESPCNQSSCLWLPLTGDSRPMSQVKSKNHASSHPPTPNSFGGTLGHQQIQQNS